MIPEPLKGRLDALIAESDRIGRKDMALALIELGRAMYPETGYEPERVEEPATEPRGATQGQGAGVGAEPAPSPEASPRLAPFAANAPPDTSAVRRLLGGLKITVEFPKD